MPILSKFPVGGKEKINNAKDVQVIAADQIKIGDTVYTVDERAELEWDRDPAIPLDNTVYAAAFSPDGKLLVLGFSYSGVAKLYAVDNTEVSYISDINVSSEMSTVRAIAFSPDGGTLVLGGTFAGRAKVYSVNGTTITYVSDIYADAGTTALDSYVYTAAFSPDGATLILGGDFTGKAKVYYVDGASITYTSDIYADAGMAVFSNCVNAVAFSPNNSLLILGCGEQTSEVSGCAKVYSIDGLTVTYIRDIYADSDMSAFDGGVVAVAISPDGNVLVLGGEFSGGAKVYSINGNTVDFVSNVSSRLSFTQVRTTAFSKDGKGLALGGGFNGAAAIFSMDGPVISDLGPTPINPNEKPYDPMCYVHVVVFSPHYNTLIVGGDTNGRANIFSTSLNAYNIYAADYVSCIYANKVVIPLSSTVYTIAFSPDGSTLVLGGAFEGKAKVYSVSGTKITYISDIYADASETALSSTVSTASFSPNGKLLVLGGSFSGMAKAYSVNGTSITYISDLYADGGTTALSAAVNASAFSPDGSIMILGGAFTGKANVYVVNETVITYVGNIYADAGETVLSSTVYTISFSPDGSTLVLGGAFTGGAKVYSVSGVTVTYVGDIYADSTLTALIASVNTVLFSPDGNTLVICSGVRRNIPISNYAKVYSVSGTTITYESDIYADGESTAFSSGICTVAFSPSGEKLVLGGYPNCHPKVYSVAGSEVTYIGDMYLNRDGDSFTGRAYVYTAMFSPDEKLLLIGGTFAGNVCAYPGAVPIYPVSDGVCAYLADEGSVPTSSCNGVGYAKQDISAGYIGDVRVIASVEL